MYETDTAKVAFTLSYMNDKEALQWKEQFINSITVYRPSHDGSNFPKNPCCFEDAERWIFMIYLFPPWLVTQLHKPRNLIV